MQKLEFHPMAEEIPCAEQHTEHARRGWNDGFELEYEHIWRGILEDGLDLALNATAKRWRKTHDALGFSLAPTPLILGIQSARCQFIERHMDTPPQRRW